MDSKIVNIVIALIAALLFLIAIGIDGWGCGGSILSEACLFLKVNKVTGALLMTSALLVVIGAICLILIASKDNSVANFVACIAIPVAAILSFTGVIYYLEKHQWWSPFLSTFAMSLTLALAVILIADFINKGGK